MPAADARRITFRIDEDDYQKVVVLAKQLELPHHYGAVARRAALAVSDHLAGLRLACKRYEESLGTAETGGDLLRRVRKFLAALAEKEK